VRVHLGNLYHADITLCRDERNNCCKQAMPYLSETVALSADYLQVGDFTPAIC
jgi:hypothetical protein